MDTTQKNREDAAQRRSRKEVPKSAQKRPQGEKKARPAEETARRRPVQQGTTPPPSAQQNNGAARTAEEQRSSAGRPQQRPERSAPRQRPQQAEPKQKREAPAEKREAVRQKPAAPKKKQPAVKKKPAPKQKRPARQADPDDISNKKRAYGNSKPKKKTTVDVMTEAFRQTAQKSAEKKAKKAKKTRPKQPTPAIIYTQPQAFNRNRFLIQLLTVTAVVVALVLGLSVFFKVETITVSGAEVYSAWSVREASGISEGDNLLTFSHARAGALIKANLPYVKSVRFGIKLPDTVNIIIDEEDVVYAIKDQNGTWWLMNSDGRVVEQTSGGNAANYTQVLGVTLDNPVANQQGIATESVPTETDGEGNLVPVLVTGAQRLNVAKQILQALEENDIVGDAASVDVTRLEDIILWYGTRYQVNLGDSSRIDYKIACMNDVILQMSDYQSGILDISFTIWPTQVGYTPFA